VSPKVPRKAKHGLSDGEHFLPFENFPWFRESPMAQLLNVGEPTPDHYHSLDLDVDLSLQIIRNPERFPLTGKTR
jgi:hypothetical protein